MARRNQQTEPLTEKILAAVQPRESWNPMTLSELYAAVPGVTLGTFHDALRTLCDAGRIRLSPFTRAYAEIAARREAMFLDGEVIFYVRPA